MRYSRQVSLVGLLIGFGGVLGGNEVVQIGAFIAFGAASVCRAIENLKEEGD